MFHFVALLLPLGGIGSPSVGEGVGESIWIRFSIQYSKMNLMCFQFLVSENKIQNLDKMRIFRQRSSFMSKNQTGIEFYGEVDVLQLHTARRSLHDPSEHRSPGRRRHFAHEKSLVTQRCTRTLLSTVLLCRTQLVEADPPHGLQSTLQ